MSPAAGIGGSDGRAGNAMTSSGARKEFVAKLRDHAESSGSIACLGMDPVMERIKPALEAMGKDAGSDYQALTSFFSPLLAFEAGAIKPNYAFFAQYGMDGLRALKDVIAEAKQQGHLVILDAKRGDIGSTSAAYVQEALFWGADAMTVHPYLGSDCVFPIADKLGAYVLCRTSNPSAPEVQDVRVVVPERADIAMTTRGSDGAGVPLYHAVASRIKQWGTGAVVGATYPAELSSLSMLWENQVPLLIPGVGAQGGSASEVSRILREAGAAAGQDDKEALSLHRVNSSSGILYAYEKPGGARAADGVGAGASSGDYVSAAQKALDALNKEIGY